LKFGGKDGQIHFFPRACDRGGTSIFEMPAEGTNLHYMDEERGDATDPLLGPKENAGARRPEDSPLWQFFHAFFFLLGGTTFIAGTGRLGLTLSV
jgi:hypothetical protein